MLVDNHMHLCPDGERLDDAALSLANIGDYVGVALARGIDEIAFTEHVYRFTAAADLLDQPFWRASAVDDLAAYHDALVAARESGLPVLAGLELDWIAGAVPRVAALAVAHHWDVVLGSVHWLETLAVDHPDFPVWDVFPVDQVWRTYTDELCAAAVSGIFDVMAHPDLPKVFGLRPSVRVLDGLYAQITEAFVAGGVCFEISTAGLRRDALELYPAQRFLERLRRARVPVTLGSDAHVADDVGQGFPRALAALGAAGYRSIVRFRGRERSVVDL